MATKAKREHEGESKAPKRVATAATAAPAMSQSTVDKLLAQAATEMSKMSQEGWICAAKIYHKLVKAGNTKAMIGLGDCYQYGPPAYKDHPDGSWVRKPKEAVRWYKKAERAGDVEGLYRHAISHMTGLGVGLDKGKAEYLLKQAADKGFDHAFHTLSCLYDGPEAITRVMDKVDAIRGTDEEVALRAELRRRWKDGTAHSDMCWWECMPNWRAPKVG